MADIAASGVTYDIQNERMGAHSRVRRLIKLDFGDGTDTYPAGGIPLTKGKMGCPNVIEELSFDDMENDDGLLYKYDRDAEKVRIFLADNDATEDSALIEYTGGATAVAATTLYVNVEGW